MTDPWTRRVWQEWEVGNLTRTFRDALLKIRAVRAPGKPVQPSHKFLAARTGCCRKTVQRALRAAQRLGLLDWCERRIRIGWRWVRTTNAYRFMVPASPPLGPATKGQFGPGELHEKKQQDKGIERSREMLWHDRMRPLLPVRSVAEQLAILLGAGSG